MNKFIFKQQNYSHIYFIQIPEHNFIKKKFQINDKVSMRQRFRSTTQTKSEVSPEQGLDFCIFINTFKNTMSKVT